MTQATTSLRDALYALSLPQQIPDAELLEEVIRRYPEHADELTEFAIELAMDTLQGQAEDATHYGTETAKVSAAVSRAVSRFHNRRFAVQRSEPRSTKSLAPSIAVPNPFAALDRSSFRALAARLNANGVFVAKLRDRQIDPNTISAGFHDRLAKELNVPIEAVVAHLSAPVEMRVRHQFYKSEDKPELGVRQSFSDAVRSSGLRDDQQQYLLAL